MQPATYLRCRAHSARDGRPCNNRPILGGVVCRIHGGSAPQVKKSARERLDEMVDPAIMELRRLIESADSDAVKLAAVKDVLDRAGYKPREKVDLNVQTVKAIDSQAWESV